MNSSLSTTLLVVGLESKSPLSSFVSPFFISVKV